MRVYRSRTCYVLAPFRFEATMNPYGFSGLPAYGSSVFPSNQRSQSAPNFPFTSTNASPSAPTYQMGSQSAPNFAFPNSQNAPNFAFPNSQSAPNFAFPNSQSAPNFTFTSTIASPSAPTYQMGSQSAPNFTSTSTSPSRNPATNGDKDSSAAKTKQPSTKRKAARYETFPKEEQEFLINLWAENHDQLESKNSRKVWSRIVDTLNEQFKADRTVDKCQRKIKYLIDKYKERKDWNRKQTGGNLWKSPLYDEIDAVLGCRDLVTLQNIKESAPSSSGSSSPSNNQVESTDDSSPEAVIKSRKERKKRRINTEAEAEDNAVANALSAVNEQGNRLTSVLEDMQKSQSEQMKMMTQFMGCMMEAMKNQQPKS